MRNFLLLSILCLISIPCFSQDKEITFGATFGSNSIFFSRDIIERSFVFFNSEFSPLKNPIIGARMNYTLTEKKNLSFGLFYGNAHLGYTYSDEYGWSISPIQGKIYRTGQIEYHSLIANTISQYKVFKWLKVQYGLSHHFNLKNTFEDKEVGNMVGWTDSTGNSNMRLYALSGSIGLEFQLHKRISIDLLHNRGITNFIVLNDKNINGSPGTKYPQKLVYTGLTLNYWFGRE